MVLHYDMVIQYSIVPSLDAEALILLLIEHDLPKVHHVLDHRIGPRGLPYARMGSYW